MPQIGWLELIIIIGLSIVIIGPKDFPVVLKKIGSWFGSVKRYVSNLQKLSDLPTVDELGSAGLIDSSTIDSSIFGTGKFYKEKQDEKKENIYSNIDEMLNSTLNDDAKE